MVLPTWHMLNSCFISADTRRAVSLDPAEGLGAE